jgi:uncharacterized membrane protein
MKKSEFLEKLNNSLTDVQADDDVKSEQLALFEHFFSAAPENEVNALLRDSESADNIISEIATRAKNAVCAPKEEMPDAEELTEQFSIEATGEMSPLKEEASLQDDENFTILDFEEIQDTPIDIPADEELTLPDMDIFDEIINAGEGYNYIDESDEPVEVAGSEELNSADDDDMLEYTPQKKVKNTPPKYKATPKFYAVAAATSPVTLIAAIAFISLFGLGYLGIFLLTAAAVAAVIISAVFGVTMTFTGISGGITAFAESACAGIFEFGIGIVCIGLAILLIALSAILIVNIPTLIKLLSGLFERACTKISALVNSAKGAFDK